MRAGVEELIGLLELVAEFVSMETPCALDLALEQARIARAGLDALIAEIEERQASARTPEL